VINEKGRTTKAKGVPAAREARRKSAERIRATPLSRGDQEMVSKRKTPVIKEQKGPLHLCHHFPEFLENSDAFSKLGEKRLVGGGWSDCDGIKRERAIHSLLKNYQLLMAPGKRNIRNRKSREKKSNEFKGGKWWLKNGTLP